jgi:BMFP domain-containing protein YqiC|tara:strand:- start:320 stop:454 length:135 start_codon:yes stop_codon:yes gene_type:complete
MRELMGKVIKELGHVFDVLSVKILENRKRIMALETRIKEIEDKK